MFREILINQCGQTKTWCIIFKQLPFDEFFCSTLSEPSKPRSITFTNNGLETNMNRLRRKYRVSWSVRLSSHIIEVNYLKTDLYVLPAFCVSTLFKLDEIWVVLKWYKCFRMIRVLSQRCNFWIILRLSKTIDNAAYKFIDVFRVLIIDLS